MVRRLTSYGFLFLFLVNSIGYYGLVELVKIQLASQTLQKFESDGQELGGNLIFGIPVEMPYSANSDEYAAVDGEIVYNDEVYQLVKEKYFNGVLYIVCKKNPQATKVREQLIDYTRMFAGQDAGQANSNIKIITLTSKDYVPLAVSHEQLAGAWSREVGAVHYSNLYDLDLTFSFFHPPPFRHHPLA